MERGFELELVAKAKRVFPGGTFGNFPCDVEPARDCRGALGGNAEMLRRFNALRRERGF
jgi:hypothetical protein